MYYETPNFTVKIMYTMNTILISGVVFCIGFFYWLVFSDKMIEVKMQYKIAWIIAIVPLNFLILGVLIYGIHRVISRIILRSRVKNNRIRANIYGYLYDTKFEISKYSYLLDYDFFSRRLNKNEINILKNNFSNQYNLDNNENCAICYEQLYKSLVTTVPYCNHKYHFECLKTWSNLKSICPQDRDHLRLLMVKHYHKDFKPRFELSYKY